MPTVAPWIIAVLIIVAGLAVGWRDVLRLSARRVWAISSVNFAESIRRRVLWITPLAILGMIAISQLQHPTDERDAVRQTIKVCLFATGIVVVITAIILAATNLPKDIDSRVIYTVVTKPTTRLEVVAGKILGFARVSAVILLIMGVFTWGYLHLRAWRLRAAVVSRLETLAPDAPSRPTLEYYARAGLLESKAVEPAADLQFFARPPDPTGPRWVAGGQGQYYLVPFQLTAEDKQAITQAGELGGGVILTNTLSYRWRQASPEDLELMQAWRLTTLPSESPQTEPSAAAGGGGATTAPASAPSTKPSVAPLGGTLPANTRAVPQISVGFLNDKRETVVTSETVNNGKPLDLPVTGPGMEQGPVSVFVPLEGRHLDRLFNLPNPLFYLAVWPQTPAVQYKIGDKPAALVVVDATGKPVRTIEARSSASDPPRVLATPGRSGMQLGGRADGTGPVAVYAFHNVRLPDNGDVVSFEFKTGLERGGTESNDETLPSVTVEIRDPKTGQVSATQSVRPESNRTTYVTFKRSEIPAGGDFQLCVRELTPGQYLGLNPDSLVLSGGDRPFAFNLAKSLLILWLLSVLVVTIAVFCSTFVSWPIAVVLTVLMLLGRWTFEQVGEFQVGSSVAQGVAGGVVSRTIRTGVDTLQAAVKALSSILPDVSRFSAIEDIARGINIPWATLGGAAMVLIGYGLPLLVLAYVRLKYREVAL